MGKRYLIDTNILLAYAGGLLPADALKLVEKAISSEFIISVINRIEILGHPSAIEEIRNFIDIANQFELTPEIVEQTILIRKVAKIKIPDAIIAATSVVHDLILLSRNTKDFKSIKGLKLVNPYESNVL